MNELVEFATSWKTYVAAVLLFSLAPDVVLHLAVLAYPKAHPRRRELPAELKIVPRRERPFWVAEQLTSVLVDGFAERRRRRNTMRRRQGKEFNLVEKVVLVLFALTFTLAPIFFFVFLDPRNTNRWAAPFAFCYCGALATASICVGVTLGVIWILPGWFASLTFQFLSIALIDVSIRALRSHKFLRVSRV